MLVEDVSDIYERSNLTRHQLLIWLGQKVHPEVPLYNVAVTITLSGKIDPGQFRTAFQKLVDSSDTLRTVIEEVDGVPRQRALERLPYEMDYLDFSGRAAPERDCEEMLRTRGREPFDFSRRLFDSALVKTGAERFVWYLNQHHIITDGVSLLLVYRYLSDLYSRSGEGGTEETAAPPRFHDYVRYELEEQKTRRHAETEAYWRKKLAEKPEPFEPYGARPRPTSRVERFSVDLGVERTQRLKALAARREISGSVGHPAVFALFAAVLFAYLYRAGGKSRLSLGVPFHNRAATPFKDVPGLVMKVIPLEITVERGDTFLSVIRKIQAAMSEIRLYREIALANAPGDRVYDVWLNYITAVYPDFHGIPAHIEWLHTGYERDAMALQVHDFDGAGSFTLDFDFHCDVFDEAERREAMSHFFKIFDAFMENPAGEIRAVSLLDGEARRRVLVDFNASDWRAPDGQTLPRLFEARARRHPDRTALRVDDGTVGYGALNEHANRLARHLRALGAGPGTIVALCVDPSPAMIAAILAILKAGAAYLPLDPQYPRERLQFMLEDAAAPLLVTHKKLSEIYPHLDGLAPRAVVYIDSDRVAIGGHRADNLGDGPAPGDLAYVIYTSGSSGAPKGVLVEHAAICNRILWGVESYGLDESDRVLQKGSFAFDASVWEIFEPLAAGAEIVMARPGGRLDLEYLADLIARESVTVAEFSPALLRGLLEDGKLAPCRALKRVFAGGEVLTAGLERAFFAQSTAGLYNTYGPTEASVDVAHWKCGGNGGGDNVPIGRPVAGMRIYILDPEMEPVPAGMPGELCIGGAGLARGYLNRPELTAALFVPDPFSDEPGARLYKTGDLARHRPDGAIEFLGRIDEQVKIRGFRIEPGEIEAELARHPAVRRAAVVARADAGEKRLAAYIVASGEPPPEPELRHFLRGRLPHYMIPARFVFLEAIPLTPSGKVDRRALPAPEEAAPAAAERAAVDTLEGRLAQIWEELLGVHPVGVEDNFFDLGGHSLLAVRLMRRIELLTGERLPLTSFLAGPTIKHLVEALIRQRTGANRLLLVEVQKGAGKPPFFYLHGDVNNGGFYCLSLARRLGGDRPFYALAPHGLNGTSVPPTVEAMAASYIGMLRAVQPEGPYYLGGICNGGIVAYEIARQLERQGSRVGQVVAIAARARTALYRRTLDRFIGGAGKWIGFGPEKKLSLFLAVRARGHRIREVYRNFLHRARLGPRYPQRLVMTRSFHREPFERAIYGYLPKPYSGRLLVLWPVEEPFDVGRDPSAGWGVVASRLQVRIVPGGHISCVRDHLPALADHIKTALDAAEKIG